MTDGDQPISATNRREVMKALGAAGTVGAVGGVAAGDEHDGEDEAEEDEPAAVADADHVVELRVEESPHPLRPYEFYYEPTGLQVNPDDEVAFVFETPGHTVTLYHPAVGRERRGPPDAEPFSSPVLGWDPASLAEEINSPPEAVRDSDEENNDTDENNEDNDTDADDIDENENNEDNDTDADDIDEDANDENEDEPQPDVWTDSFETAGVYDLYCAPHEAFGMAMRIVVGDETDPDFEVDSARELPSLPDGPVGFAKAVLTDSALEPDEIADAGEVTWEELDLNRKRDEDQGDADIDTELFAAERR